MSSFNYGTNFECSIPKKKIALYSIGVIWFLISLLPILQIIPLFTIVDEHYCYLPMLGLLIALFGLFNYFWKNLPPKILITILLPVFCFLTWKTELYIYSSRDSVIRSISMAKESPEWLKVELMLKAFVEAGSKNKMNELPSWINKRNIDDETEKWIKENLNVEPDLSYRFGPFQMPYNFSFYKGIWGYLYNTRREKELVTLINQAVKVKDDCFTWNLLTEFFGSSNEWDKSWHCLEKAIALNSRMRQLYGLPFINIAQNSGNVSRAEELIKEYINLDSKSSHPYLFAAFFYKIFPKSDLALTYAKEAIARDKVVSGYEKQLYYLAFDLFIKNQMLDEAKQTLKIVLTYIDPYDEIAKNKLAELANGTLIEITD